MDKLKYRATPVMLAFVGVVASMGGVWRGK